MKAFNNYIAIYKQQLGNEDIQKAYAGLLKYVMTLKAHFSKKLSYKYSFGNVSPGYMDFTYFPFFDDFLRERKLRFGIVLNHKKVYFELWLMGQNIEIQKKYWDLLKTSQWNKDRTTMPKYSVLEFVLVENPDFDKLDMLTQEIEKKATHFLEDIINHIREKNSL